MLGLGQKALEGHDRDNPANPQGFAVRRDQMIARFFWPALVILGLVVALIARLLTFGDIERPTDFQIFHKVGELVWQGTLGAAYDLTRFARIEAIATGQPGMAASWAYPPQFDLVAAVLGLGPIVPMYVIFILATLVAYLAVLWRLGRERAGWTLAFAFPAIMINTATGQNGFITGALIGWFALAWLREDPKAGIPLGLMVIKPHLAVGLVALTLLRRRYSVIAWAAGCVAATSLLATLALGPGVWSHFLKGAHEAGAVLQSGSLHFFRMTSVYTASRTLGIGYGPAMALHAGVAALGFVALWWLSRARVGEEIVLGFAVLTTLLVSPYVYDYDFTIFGVALALLAPALAQSHRAAETLLVWAAAWVVCGWGFAGIFGMVVNSTTLQSAPDPAMPSLPGVIYPLLAFGLLRVAARGAQEVDADAWQGQPA